LKGLGDLSTCWTWRVGPPWARLGQPLHRQITVPCLERATWRSARTELRCLRVRSRTASTYGSCPPNDFKSAYKLSPVSESSTTPSEKSTHGPAPCSPDCKLVAG